MRAGNRHFSGKLAAAHRTFGQGDTFEQIPGPGSGKMRGLAFPGIPVR
jgi:hypothetical protein